MALNPLPTFKELFTGRMGGSSNKERTLQKDGQDIAPAVILVDRLVKESTDSLNNKKIDGDRNMKDWWLFCHRRFVGDHHDVSPQDELVQFTLNRDQVSILTNVAEQTQQPFSPIYTPIEVNDEPVYFLSRSGVLQIDDMMQHQLDDSIEGKATQSIPVELNDILSSMSTAQLLGREPIGSSSARKLRRFTEPRIGADNQPIDPVLQTNAIVEINDALRAERLEKLVHLKWNQGKCDQRMKLNELYSNIYGHAVSWCNIDENDWDIKLRNVHPRNALADPVQFIVDDFHYCVITEMISLHEAIGRWPEYESILTEASITGVLGDSEDPDMMHLGSVYGDTNFQRDMVIIRNAYVRDSTLPMEPAQALEKGLIIEMEEGGYLLASNDEPISPGDDAWPNDHGIRFIKTLPQIQELIEDRMSKYDDIPVGWNLNIPIPFDHHGMGEPFRTKDVTDAINKAGEIIVNYLLYFPYPCEIWPQDVLDSYADQGKEEPYTHPGRQWGIDGIHYEDYLKGNSRGFAIQPPDMPSVAARVWDDFRLEHDVIAGRPDVRSGQAPGANTSGAAISALVQKASGPVSFKASFTGDTVARLGRIIGSYYAKYMPKEHWKAIFSDLTPASIDYVFKDGAMTTLDFDVRCDVAASLLANQERAMQKVLEDLNFGLINKEDARAIRQIPNNARQERKIAREMRLNNPPVPQQQEAQSGPVTPGGTLQPM